MLNLKSLCLVIALLSLLGYIMAALDTAETPLRAFFQHIAHAELIQAEPSVPPISQAIPPAATINAKVSGKDSLLTALWSAEELKGRPEDKRIVSERPSRPDPSPGLPDTRKLPPLKSQMLNSIRRVPLDNFHKMVALTFDLCEQADEKTGYDRDIVNLLREKNVKASFFAGGKWMQSHEEKSMQLMADPNFELGNHGWTHGNLRVLSGERMRQQIVRTQAEYERIREKLRQKAKAAGRETDMQRVPPQLKTLRFPYGTCSAESLQAVNDWGLGAVQWDVVSGDAARGTNPVVMAASVIRETRPGSIIIFHANGRGHGTAAALPTVIGELRAKGFQFVTVSELLAVGKPETVTECYENKPGDNKRYDALFGEGTGE